MKTPHQGSTECDCEKSRSLTATHLLSIKKPMERTPSSSVVSESFLLRSKTPSRVAASSQGELATAAAAVVLHLVS